MKLNKTRILFAVVALFILIQFIPASRTNPPAEIEIKAPAEVQAILERSCYDCHSNNTTWPFYSYIAPVSWLVAKDVMEGRRHVNFTTWNQYDADRLADIFDDLYDEIDEGEMPLWFYVPLHPKSKLSETDKNILKDWAVQAAADINLDENAEIGSEIEDEHDD